MPKTILLADDSVTIQKVVGISFANEDVVLVTASGHENLTGSLPRRTKELELLTGSGRKSAR